eukprot:jgi/Tetstr1/442433/TSEL_030557.t1
MAPTSCVPGLRKQRGHTVQWRPVGADHLRAWGFESYRGTRCSGSPLAPTNYVPGLRAWPGHTVQWRPDGADHLRARAAEAAGAHGAVTARWRRPTACPGCELGRGTRCSGGLMAPTICVPGLGKLPGHTWRPVGGADQLRARAAELRGTWCNGGMMAPTSCVPGLRDLPGHKMQRRLGGADQQRAGATQVASPGAAEATKGHMV